MIIKTLLKLKGDQKVHISAIGWGREMGCMREMADALWEGHTLLKTGLSAHRHRHRQTDRQK